MEGESVLKDVPDDLSRCLRETCLVRSSVGTKLFLGIVRERTRGAERIVAREELDRQAGDFVSDALN